MKLLSATIGFFFVGTSIGWFASQHAAHKAGWITDPQVAAGEWTIQLQTPPCDSVHNVQVILPEQPAGVLTVECNLLPVAER